MKKVLMTIKGIEILSKDDKILTYKFIGESVHHSLNIRSVKRIVYTDGKARIILKSTL